MLCSEFGKRGAIAIVVAQYHAYSQEVTIQQQAIWALDALSTYKTNLERFKTNGVIPILHELLVTIPKYGKQVDKTSKGRKQAVAEKTDPSTVAQVIVPYNLLKLYTEKELIEGSRPPKPTKTSQKKGNHLRPRPKKTKFGRVGDDPSWQTRNDGGGSLAIEVGTDLEEAMKKDPSLR